MVKLRFHGVSGTPPRTTLGTDPIVMPDTDGEIDLYSAPVLETQLDVDKGSGIHQVELRQLVYHWSKLTAGKARYALWQLSLPYTLVNVAGWMMPMRRRLDRPKYKLAPGEP